MIGISSGATQRLRARASGASAAMRARSSGARAAVELNSIMPRITAVGPRIVSRERYAKRVARYSRRGKMGNGLVTGAGVGIAAAIGMSAAHRAKNSRAMTPYNETRTGMYRSM